MTAIPPPHLAMVMRKVRETAVRITAHQKTLKEIEAALTEAAVDHVLDRERADEISRWKQTMEEWQAQIANLEHLGPQLRRRLKKDKGKRRRALAAHHARWIEEIDRTMQTLDDAMHTLRTDLGLSSDSPPPPCTPSDAPLPSATPAEQPRKA